jgi:hypothetical protein
MLIEDYKRLTDEINERRAKITLGEKGVRYAGGKNKLGNFHRTAQSTGLSPIVVAWLYAMKHLDWIQTTISALISNLNADEFSPEELRTFLGKDEGFAARADDLRNYLDLLEALMIETDIHPDYESYSGKWKSREVAGEKSD